MAHRIEVGDKAPDFTLVSQSGEEVRLADRLRDRVVVLYFYPKDETRGCTAEACAFRGDLLHRQPGHDTESQRDLRVARQRGMTTGESEPEKLVIVLRWRRRRQKCQFLLADTDPAQLVDGLAPRRGREPARRVGRYAVGAPVLRGLDEGIVNRVLGKPHVT